MRATPENRKQRRAILNRERVRRHVARRRAGLAIYSVEISESVITMLVKFDWLRDEDATDPRAVATAITAMLNDAASGLS